ncbi:hypothetical protein LJR153_005055 [Paenibacillus sp. LjRoot153]|uniref:hypothetical protein n=1 Tax=Paenibacillus sp. LjRoot153 TaxID=3342270 RepID=UPI003ED079BF
MKVFNEELIIDDEVKGKLVIESDSLGYQVKLYNGTRIDDKTKKEIELSTTIGNFMTGKGCCKFLMNLKIKQSTAETLLELMKDVERIEQWIESKVDVLRA